MFWFRPKFIAFIFIPFLSFLLVGQNAQAYFTDDDCMGSSFKIQIAHKAIPLGISENILKIEKERCVLKINHEKYKFLLSGWLVDICRGPIHIKKGISGIEVIKRNGQCQIGRREPNEFCSEWEKIKQIIQDDGLIFAEGEKENLKTDHGKTYCSYILIKKYLQDGVIFNSDKKLGSILRNGQVHSLDEDTQRSTVVVPPPPQIAPEGQSEPAAPKVENKEAPPDSLKF